MKIQYILVYCLLALFVHSATAQPQVEFIENKGQWPVWYKYKATLNGAEVLIENNDFRYILSDPTNDPKIDSFHHGQMSKAPLMKFHVYKMSFEGANPQPEIKPLKEQKNYYNYFIGNDPAKWKSNIHPFLAMDYLELYKGINMHVSSDGSALVYEFFVQPGADASQVKLAFEGQDKIYLNDGNLIINTSVGKVMEMKPVAFQYINDTKTQVACHYRLRNSKVTFEFPDGYDHSAQLIIDPTVVFSSLSGSTADNWGFTATYDNAGNFYMGGIVNGLKPGTSFPVSPGAYQSVFAGGKTIGGGDIAFASDIGIMKLSPDGRTRIYATYIGGQNNERPHSLIVDPGTGDLLIAGRSCSWDYPVTSGAFRSANAGGWDIIVTRLNAAGTALVGSTYIGGTGEDGVNFDSTEGGYSKHLKFNYGDDARSEVQVDNAGNVYVASCTWSTDFPTVSGIASTLAGEQDGVVFKMNSSLTSLLWSTYIRGAADDAAYVLSFNKTQTAVYVAGGTSSADLPVSSGAWQPSYRGDSADGYILKFQNSPPYSLQKGTYIGTTNYDQVYGIQVDASGNVYAMGQSVGGLFPVTAGVYTNPNSCQFIIKLDSDLTTDLISTVYGSGDPSHTNISPVAFLVDTCENVYISGWGGNIFGLARSKVGGTTGMPVTSDAHQATTDDYDFYFIVLGSGMSTLRYATFYGRSTPGQSGLAEHVDGGTSRFDKSGIIYQGICANCGGPSSTPFPTTSGAWATTVGSDNCNQAALKIAFNLGPVDAAPHAGPETDGCAPLTVNFTNTSSNGLSYVWNFGDGSSSTAFEPTHTFTGAGTFTVTLTAANSSACFKTDDTAYVIIRVDTNIIKPNFDYVLKDSCGPYIASFTNTSVDHVGTPEFTWYLGDGTSYTGATPPDHAYADTGTYKVMLVMRDPLACKSPDTMQKKMRIHNFRVTGSFTGPDTVCVGSDYIPAATIENAASILWTLPNGTTSTIIKPLYKFTKTGTYIIRILVTNAGACNGLDSMSRKITVIDGPVADFTFGPVPAVANEPVRFTNQSVNALTYAWDFGDKTTGTETNPIHQYNRTGSYKACLEAKNLSACPSSVCKEVYTEVVPIIGLPTAFTPNGDGENDVLYVRGAAIKTLELKIFNRWGQLVFETNTKEKGWDGTFNGLPQPIEAYAYVLNAGFIDGTSKLLKGNITLLR